MTAAGPPFPEEEAPPLFVKLIIAVLIILPVLSVGITFPIPFDPYLAVGSILPVRLHPYPACRVPGGRIPGGAVPHGIRGGYSVGAWPVGQGVRIAVIVVIIVVVIVVPVRVRIFFPGGRRR